MSACRATRSLPSGRSFEEQKKIARGRLNSIKRKQKHEIKQKSSETGFSPAPISSTLVSPSSSIISNSIIAETNRSIHTSQSRDELLEEYKSDETLVRIKIHSKRVNSGFYVPVSMLIEREHSMRETALQYGIGDDRWLSSLLYREWKKLVADSDDLSSEVAEDRSNFVQSEKHPNGDVTINLYPERDCAHSNHSKFLEWTDWLTASIRSFYNSGMIQIPNNCKGNDILLALEYFGIIYSPDQLSYESFGVYLRVKLWSEYFTHRSVLGEWVMAALLRAPSKHSHYIVTAPTTLTPAQTVFVGSTRGVIFDGALNLDPDKYEGLPSCAVVHDFFHNQDHSTVCRSSKEQPLDELMRKDFAAYLQASLPGTSITFTLRDDVTISDKPQNMQNAVLHIDLLSAVSIADPEKESTEVSSTLPPRQADINDVQSKFRSQSQICRINSEKNEASLTCPIKSFGDGDKIDVLSGITSPWKEDEMAQACEAMRENLIQSEQVQLKNVESSFNPKDAKDPEIGPITSQLTQQGVSALHTANENFDNATKMNSTTLPSDSRIKSDENIHKGNILTSGLTQKTAPFCGDPCLKDANNASISGISAYSPSNCNAFDSALDSLSATLTLVLNSIPDSKKQKSGGIQPIVELPPNVKIDRSIFVGQKSKPKANEASDDTRSDEMAYREGLVTFDKFINNDPVPDTEDEYLRLARAASKVKPVTLAPEVSKTYKTTPKASRKGTRTKESMPEFNSNVAYNGNRLGSVLITSGSAVSTKLQNAETCIPVARAVPLHSSSSPIFTNHNNREKRRISSNPNVPLNTDDHLNGVASRKMCIPQIFIKKRQNRKRPDSPIKSKSQKGRVSQTGSTFAKEERLRRTEGHFRNKPKGNGFENVYII